MKKFLFKKDGFTLIELLIYLAIAGAIAIFLTGFLWNIIWLGTRETSFSEVEQSGRFTLNKIAAEIKKATAIVSPGPGESSDTLVLEMASSSLNPTVFSQSSGKLTVSRGATNPFDLTTDNVVLQNLSFSNLSYQNTPGTIKIEMEISYLNPENLWQYRAQIIFKSTVSLVPGGAAP